MRIYSQEPGTATSQQTCLLAFTGPSNEEVLSGIDDMPVRLSDYMKDRAISMVSGALGSRTSKLSSIKDRANASFTPTSLSKGSGASALNTNGAGGGLVVLVSTTRLSI